MLKTITTIIMSQASEIRKIIIVGQNSLKRIITTMAKEKSKLVLKQEWRFVTTRKGSGTSSALMSRMNAEKFAKPRFNRKGKLTMIILHLLKLQL